MLWVMPPLAKVLSQTTRAMITPPLVAMPFIKTPRVVATLPSVIKQAALTSAAATMSSLAMGLGVTPILKT